MKIEVGKLYQYCGIMHTKGHETWIVEVKRIEGTSVALSYCGKDHGWMDEKRFIASFKRLYKLGQALK